MLHSPPPASKGTFPHALPLQYMQHEEKLDLRTMERVGKQTRLLLRLYQAELAKDPASPATESSRSNMIALHHSIKQIYGDTATLEVNGDLASSVDSLVAMIQD